MKNTISQFAKVFSIIIVGIYLGMIFVGCPVGLNDKNPSKPAPKTPTTSEETNPGTPGKSADPIIPERETPIEPEQPAADPTDIDVPEEGLSDKLGEHHPLTGNYSPVDKNGDTIQGFGWDTQAFAPGAKLTEKTTTFAVYSANATKILLEIYDTASGKDALFDYWLEKGDDNYWRAELNGNLTGSLYAFRAWGPNWEYNENWTRGNSDAGFVQDYDKNGNRFNPNKVLYDPYARELTHDKSNPDVLLAGGVDNSIYATGDGDINGTVRRNFDTGKYAPKSVIVKEESWTSEKPKIAQKDAIIYEAHVRGFTNHDSTANLTDILSGFDGFDGVVDIPADKKGTYAGAALMAPYQKGLGINTIELLPVHETDNDCNPDDGSGGNFWGYMTFGYFAPDRRYSSDKSFGGPTKEFKEMVQAFHDAGIEVYLDVVYNHSGEGGNWGNDDEKKKAADILSMKGLDNSSWYCINDNGGGYWETTGCGNNLRCDTPMVRQFILDSLAYWIDKMGVDGFRFDLAPVLGREESNGSWNFNQSATTLKAITELGSNRNVEMIAEAWDCQREGGYQVGKFPNGWGEWNGRFRDSIRAYVGAGNSTSQDGITNYINGDYDNFNDQGGAHKSVNFVVAHDGFTLADLCSYEGVGNAQNDKLTWPFGPSDDGNTDYNSLAFGQYPEMKRQAARNYIALQMISRGVPLIVYGDELCRTQNGNNNPYNIDSVATWNNYNMINTSEPHNVSTGGVGSYHNNFGKFDNDANKNGNFAFMQYMIKLRANEPALRQSGYDVSYDFRKENGKDYLENGDRCIWIRINGSKLNDGSDYLVLSNMWKEKVDFSVPPASNGKVWKILVDTANWAEGSFNCFDEAKQQAFKDSTYGVNPWSVVILKETTANPTVKSPVITSSTEDSFFTGSATITLSCGTADATIYYTLDGTEPTVASKEYTSSFTINKSTEIKAIAVKEGFENSALARKKLTSGDRPTENKSGVMLQGFNWGSASRDDESRHGTWYGIMKEQATSINNTFEYVWFPPASKTSEGSPEGYCPTELNDLNNYYGTADELKAVISAISPAKAIADIVVNHRDGNWGDFTNPTWGVVSCENYQVICRDDEGFTGDNEKMGKSTEDMRGNADTGESFSAARDLDHTNPVVQNGIIDWMNDILMPAGFVGWRYDYVKGFSGNYVGQYNQGSNAIFSVGEYWPTTGFNANNPSVWANEINNWINKTEEGGQRSRAFDFVLKGIMNEVFGSKGENIGNKNYALLANAASLMQSHPEDAVTFVDNHDTGSTQQHWYLDPDDVGTAYAFILTHPGFPCVAWQHYFTDSESGNHNESQYIGGNTVLGTDKTYRQHIDYLIDLRKSVGIEYDDKAIVLYQTGNGYAAKITGTNGELVVLIGSGYTPTGDGYDDNYPIYSGTNFKIWQKGVAGTEPAIDDPEQPDPQPTGVEITVTTSDWARNDNAVIWAWCWGGYCEDGKWIECSGSGTTVQFTLDSDITAFKLVRFPSEHQCNWDKKWNESENMNYSSGTTSYTLYFN